MLRALTGPLFRAARLSARRELQRAFGMQGIKWKVAAVAASVLFALSSSVARPGFASLLDRLVQYRVAVAALVFVHALLLVSRERRKFTDQFRHSWLIAAPLSTAHLAAWLRVRTACNAAWQMIAIACSVAAIAAAAGNIKAGLALCAVLAAPFIAGGLVGWWLPSKVRPSRESSRYALNARPHELSCSSQALSRWPVAQALSWHRPENARVTLLIALFAVQGGSSMLAGLLVVSAWLMASYLTSLLRGSVQVARSASQWLRATPLHFFDFAWPLARRVLLHQLLGSGIAAGLALALGMPAFTTLYLLALWLTLVVMVLCVSLADSFCRSEARGKLLLSIIAAAALEVRQHGWSLPWLMLLSVWHLRRGFMRYHSHA